MIGFCVGGVTLGAGGVTLGGEVALVGGGGVSPSSFFLRKLGGSEDGGSVTTGGRYVGAGVVVRLVVVG